MWSCLPLIIMTGASLDRNITGDVMVSDSKSAEAKFKSTTTVSCHQFWSVLSKHIDCLQRLVHYSDLEVEEVTKSRLSHIKTIYLSWILNLCTNHWRTNTSPHKSIHLHNYIIRYNLVSENPGCLYTEPHTYKLLTVENGLEKNIWSVLAAHIPASCPWSLIHFPPVERPMPDLLPLPNNNPGNATESYSFPGHTNNFNSAHKYACKSTCKSWAIKVKHD